jgi:hypothetical protein
MKFLLELFKGKVLSPTFYSLYAHALNHNHFHQFSDDILIIKPTFLTKASNLLKRNLEDRA